MPNTTGWYTSEFKAETVRSGQASRNASMADVVARWSADGEGNTDMGGNRFHNFTEGLVNAREIECIIRRL